MNNAAKSGMTLLEVMISFFILSLVLILFLNTFGMGKKAEVQGTAHLTAMHNARSAMESLKSCSYFDPELTIGNHTIPGGFYTVSFASGFQLTKDVHITLYWVDPLSSKTSTLILASSVAGALHE